MNSFRLSMVAVAFSLAISGCGDSSENETASEPSTPPAPETFTVSGYLDLISGSIYVNDDFSCEGADGYADLREGAQVTIFDASGSKIALGSLAEGREIDLGAVAPCRFEFEVADVPAEGSIFSVEVTSRGQVDFTKEEASSIALSLGD